MKAHFFSQEKLSVSEQPMKISLYGTLEEKEDIPFILYVDETTDGEITDGAAEC